MSNNLPHYLDTVEAEAREQFQAAVEQELVRLAQQPNYQLRRRTIMELALAEVTPGQSWNSVLGGDGIVSKQTFYSRNKDWNAGTSDVALLFQEVLAEVCRLYRLYYGGQDMRQQEARRRAHVDAILELTDAGMDKLRQMLAFPVSDQVTEVGDGVTKVIQSPNFSWSQVATLLAAVDKHARLAMGLYADKSQVDFTNLSDDEVEAIARGK